MILSIKIHDIYIPYTKKHPFLLKQDGAYYMKK